MKPDYINSVEKAIGWIASDDFRQWAKPAEPVFREWPDYQEPFGIWFRGQAWPDLVLVPSIFSEDLYTDESSMTHHFMLRAAGSGERCRNTFDWLCLMRHFELPTRLLDWSENLLVALYFAVLKDQKRQANDYPKEQGNLFVLNASKFNRAVRKTFSGLEDLVKYRAAHGITVPWSIEAALRAEMSRARSMQHFLDLIESFDRDCADDAVSLDRIKRALITPTDGLLNALATPLAAFPNRLYSRMILQQSVFTIHGGKARRTKEGLSDAHGLLPLPISIFDVAKKMPAEDGFLQHIPVVNKPEIKRQLEYMGIHEGSLFPELDRQAAYIKMKWQFDEREQAAQS